MSERRDEALVERDDRWSRVGGGVFLDDRVGRCVEIYVKEHGQRVGWTCRIGIESGAEPHLLDRMVRQIDKVLHA